MITLSLLALFLAISGAAAIIIIVEEHEIKFWLSNLKPWSKVWKISLCGAVTTFWVNGILSIYRATKANLLNIPIPIVIAGLLSIGFNMIFWLVIWNLRLDWWNAGMRWQRILIGSSFTIATVLLIVAGFLSVN